MFPAGVFFTCAPLLAWYPPSTVVAHFYDFQRQGTEQLSQACAPPEIIPAARLSIADDDTSITPLRQMIGQLSSPAGDETSATGKVPSKDLEKLRRKFRSLYGQGKYGEAEQLAEDLIKLARERFGKQHRQYAFAIEDLAYVYMAQARYSDAAPIFKQSVEIWEKAVGVEHPFVANALANLASLFGAEGNYPEAESYAKKALAMREKALGQNHIAVASSLSVLAKQYSDQGHYARAEQLYRRAVEIYERLGGQKRALFSVTLGNLAAIYMRQHKLSAAEPLLERNLVINEEEYGPAHPYTGSALSSLAELHEKQGRYSQALSLYERALEITEKLGVDHPGSATVRTKLGRLHTLQGHFVKAEALYKQAVTSFERSLGPTHPLVDQTRSALAAIYVAQERWEHAATQWRRSTEAFEHRIARRSGQNESMPSVSDNSESARSRDQFVGLIKVALVLASKENAGIDGLNQETFKKAQWARESQAAGALALMSARSAGGSPALGSLVRERQDLVAEWSAKDKLLIAAKSEPPAKRNAAAETVLSDRLAAIDVRLAAIDARLAKEFPDYTAFVSPKPISVANVQAELNDDEALILFLDTDAHFKPLPEETFVWVVTKQQVRWLRSALGTAALSREVAALRCGLDATAWYDEGAQRCADHLQLSLDKVPRAGKALPFDATRANALYVSLLGAARDLIAGKHLLVVPSGALTTLPFQVLVTEPPKSNDLASARWLIRDHAITVLPSVGSLSALRRTGNASTAPKPMIGFANPLLDGDQTDARDGAWYKEQAQRARTETGCATTPKQRTAALRSLNRSPSPVPQTAGLADLAHLRMQTPLPETADEVCEVARSIGADARDMRIGTRATETEVKRLSETRQLAAYRILHFATHGVLAGQLSGTHEPGLILTPPATSTAQDDGYLSASEIAGLKLDADWVILSACNTAGGAGEGEAAEALSGLARVFFYAGARALLVSHWEVDSDAAVKIVTGAIRALAKDKTLGRAEALRQGMLAVMADTTRPKGWVPASHPAVWAPFVVVGEGGRGR